MCPAYLTSMMLVSAGATSTGGVTALVVKKLRAKSSARGIPTKLAKPSCSAVVD